MPFCPNCGNEVGNERFCQKCGAEQGTSRAGSDFSQTGPPRPPPQSVRVTSGIQYDGTICVILCCCLSPVAALIYYLLTEHPPQDYAPEYRQ